MFQNIHYHGSMSLSCAEYSTFGDDGAAAIRNPRIQAATVNSFLC